MVTRREVGAIGEDAAAAEYVAQGYVIVARNWRVADGEIDIVARKGTVLVVCEVKTRTSDAFGAPAEAVTRTKQLRLRRLGAQYLAAHPAPGCVIRFDVASVRPGGARPHVEIIEAAF